jgi:hypothetical protein
MSGHPHHEETQAWNDTPWLTGQRHASTQRKAGIFLDSPPASFQNTYTISYSFQENSDSNEVELAIDSCRPALPVLGWI